MSRNETFNLNNGEVIQITNTIIIDGITCFSLGVATKLLNTGFGRTRFMELLREWGVLLNKNEPSQRMIEYGYMIYFPKSIAIPGKKDKIIMPVTYVTIKGLYYLQKLFRNRFSKSGSEKNLNKNL